MIRRESSLRHKLLLYCLSAGQVEDYIKEWKPDVVHIHISTYSLPYIVAVAKVRLRCISTSRSCFHNDIVPASPFSKGWRESSGCIYA